MYCKQAANPIAKESKFGVFSSNGGVGKSIIAELISKFFVILGYRTILCDMDPTMDSTATNFFKGVAARYGLNNLIEDPSLELSKVIRPYDFGGNRILDILPGSITTLTSADGFRTFAGAMAKRDYDVIIYDLGRGTEDPTFPFLGNTDIAGLVVDENILSVQDAGYAIIGLYEQYRRQVELTPSAHPTLPEIILLCNKLTDMRNAELIRAEINEQLKNKYSDRRIYHNRPLRIEPENTFGIPFLPQLATGTKSDLLTGNDPALTELFLPVFKRIIKLLRDENFVVKAFTTIYGLIQAKVDENDIAEIKIDHPDLIKMAKPLRNSEPILLLREKNTEHVASPKGGVGKTMILANTARETVDKKIIADFARPRGAINSTQTTIWRPLQNPKIRSRDEAEPSLLDDYDNQETSIYFYSDRTEAPVKPITSYKIIQQDSSRLAPFMASVDKGYLETLSGISVRNITWTGLLNNTLLVTDWSDPEALSKTRQWLEVMLKYTPLILEDEPLNVTIGFNRVPISAIADFPKSNPLGIKDERLLRALERHNLRYRLYPEEERFRTLFSIGSPVPKNYLLGTHVQPGESAFLESIRNPIFL